MNVDSYGADLCEANGPLALLRDGYRVGTTSLTAQSLLPAHDLLLELALCGRDPGSAVWWTYFGLLAAGHDLPEETRRFIRAAASWRAGLAAACSLLSDAGVRRPYFPPHRMDTLDEVRQQEFFTDLVRRMDWALLAEMEGHVADRHARRIILAEMARRKRSGHLRPPPVGGELPPAFRLWALWLRAGYGAPSFCWWSWAALNSRLGSQTDDPLDGGAHNAAARLGLVPAVALVVGCTRAGNRLRLACRQSVNPHDRQETELVVPAAAYVAAHAIG